MFKLEHFDDPNTKEGYDMYRCQLCDDLLSEDDSDGLILHAIENHKARINLNIVDLVETRVSETKHE